MSEARGEYLQQPAIVRPRIQSVAARALRTLDPMQEGESASVGAICTWPYLRNWQFLCDPENDQNK